MTDHTADVVAKLKGEGLSDAFVAAFSDTYKQLRSGATGLIPESSIKAATVEDHYDKLPSATPSDAALLSKTVFLKLNGGLGTSMGLEKAKSLLHVKPDVTFLDVICKQIIALRKKHEAPNLRFMFMVSFSTADDTKHFLETHYPELAKQQWELMQNKAPKVLADTFAPASSEKNPDQEWCPPGHGDLYSALAGSGQLDALLKDGIEYAFVSNSDNLGATLDVSILKHFAASGAPMLMEVCERTDQDKKGGHLAASATDGRLLLRELANCPSDDQAHFQDIGKHRFFNTNSLWLHLPSIKKAIEAGGGALSLPLIVNRKTLDPRDPTSPKVIQLETAMGAAIAALPGARALVVPRSRFAPVKTTADLFLLRSDLYCVSEEGDVQLNPRRGEAVMRATGRKVLTADEAARMAEARSGSDARGAEAKPEARVAGELPRLVMDDTWKLVDALDELCPAGVPSLVAATSITVKGRVCFLPKTVISGSVHIENPGPQVINFGGNPHD
eukprot:TRINITY_DN4617_c0_g1_i1.p1 TRINITY_DN4617_c0_g1~~TRINITY_DN4617_c0_g1_i1.p1  ORF type:complete len:502 (-),score=117.06 TRINITY_DN4617_c0_g1_i1:631-2136(-)